MNAHIANSTINKIDNKPFILNDLGSSIAPRTIINNTIIVESLSSKKVILKSVVNVIIKPSKHRQGTIISRCFSISFK